ncbi:hypothetical protein SMICM17S_11069 [Streptomyces microflavus]
MLRGGLVAYGDGAEDGVVVFDDDDGGSRALETGHLCAEGAGVDEAGLAQACRGAFDGAGQTVAGDGLDVLSPREGELVGGGEDRCRQGVFAPRFESGGDAQDAVAFDAGGGDHIDDGGVVTGEGAGLVEGDDPYGAERLDGGAALDEHSGLGGCADGGDHGDGDGQGEGARCGGDQNNQGAFDPDAGVAEQAAHGGDQRGQDQDAGDQGAGEAGGQALAVALAFLGVLDDVDQTGQGVVLGGRGDGYFQDTGAVDGSGEDFAAWADFAGDGLPGHDGGVQGAAPGAHGAVGGDLLAGPDHQDVADDEFCGLHLLLGVARRRGRRG